MAVVFSTALGTPPEYENIERVFRVRVEMRRIQAEKGGVELDVVKITNLTAHILRHFCVLCIAAEIQ